MTHLCYTLDEAAEKLNLSETVLVRLSQSFRVPEHAYEEVGYLSFKGDLTFSDQDIAFFRQVKERLLAGETLEEVKSRIRHNEPADPVAHALPTPSVVTSSQPEAYRQAPSQEPTPPREPIGLSGLRESAATVEQASRPKTVQAPKPVEAPHSSNPAANLPPREPFYTDITRKQASQEPAYAYRTTEPELPLSAPMVEIEDRTPFERAAERSFNRYKNMHHPGLGKVFEKMMKEVGSTSDKEAPRREKPSVAPSLKPMKAHVEEPGGHVLEDIHPDAQLPFKTRRREAAPAMPWESVLQQAISQPRALNTHLKAAAMLLRQRALGPDSAPAASQSIRKQ